MRGIVIQPAMAEFLMYRIILLGFNQRMIEALDRNDDSAYRRAKKEKEEFLQSVQDGE